MEDKLTTFLWNDFHNYTWKNSNLQYCWGYIIFSLNKILVPRILAPTNF